MAYCLLGIVDVNMLLLYGEGGVKAFDRLQLKILQQSNDESSFAGRRGMALAVNCLSNRHLALLDLDSDIVQCKPGSSRCETTCAPNRMINKGLEIRMSMLSHYSYGDQGPLVWSSTRSCS